MRRRLLFLFVLTALVGLLASPALAASPKEISMKLGSSFTITGRTGSEVGIRRAVGKVVVTGSWGAGSFRVLTTTKTDRAGNYRFTLTPRRRGDLTLRIAPPDHRPQHYVVHVR